MRGRTVRAVALAVDIEDADGTLVAHALLGDADDLVVVLAERDALHGGGELPAIEALAGLHRPEAHGVVGGARDQKAGLSCIRAAQAAG